MSYLYLDFETRSPCDIKTAGASRYAAHPETETLCLGWSHEDRESVWFPRERVSQKFMGDDPYDYSRAPKALKRAIEGCDAIVCWNRQFDQLIYEHILVPVGWPEKPWIDAALLARACNLPGSLGACADFLGYKMGKMSTGTNLIRALSIPPYQTSPELLRLMGEYCLRDVVVMRVLVEDELLSLLPEEYVVHLGGVDDDNFKIGERGVRVRTEFCRHAMVLAGMKNENALDEIIELTDGEVCKLRGPSLLKWVSARLPDRHLAKITRERANAKSSLSLDEEARRYLLGASDVTGNLRRVIELVDEVSKSSVHKYQTMADMAHEDGRVRHAIVAWGGQQTGRFSARGLQVHNFPRDSEDLAEEKAVLVAEHFRDGTPDQVIDVLDKDQGVHTFLSRMLRPTIIPADGSVFVVADWSNIEGRINPWLWANAIPDGDNHGASAKLQRFDAQDKGGAGVYETTAADIFGVAPEDVDAEQRQIGKVAELALGYGGGVNAFVAMGRNYGVTLDLDTAGWVVDAWRETNAWAVRLWDTLDHAFRQAFATGAMTTLGGLLRYEKIVAPGGYQVMRATVRGFDGGNFHLFYHDVRVEHTGDLTCAKANRKADKTGKWPRMSLWHGLLCENLVQALAADLLRSVLRPDTLPIALHVHDEVVLEVPRALSEEWRARLEEIMEYNDDINPRLPLRAEARIMEAFGK